MAPLNEGDWPPDLASPGETRDNWPFRTTVYSYPILAKSAPALKVMLVFGRKDHATVPADKPHVHHAYDGFKKDAGLWVRLNPDHAYFRSVLGIDDGGAVPDNPANTEPDDWADSGDWGYDGPKYRVPGILQRAPLAALAEMTDRVQADNWEDDLNDVLFGG